MWDVFNASFIKTWMKYSIADDYFKHLWQTWVTLNDLQQVVDLILMQISHVMSKVSNTLKVSNTDKNYVSVSQDRSMAEKLVSNKVLIFEGNESISWSAISLTIPMSHVLAWFWRVCDFTFLRLFNLQKLFSAVFVSWERSNALMTWTGLIFLQNDSLSNFSVGRRDRLRLLWTSCGRQMP